MAKTPLQEAINDAFADFPEKDDAAIAKHVFENMHDGEEYQGKSPSMQYVGRMRKRHHAQTRTAEVEIAIPEGFFDVPELDETEEPDDDQAKVDPFEGFNLDEAGKEVEPEKKKDKKTQPKKGFNLDNKMIGTIVSLPFNKIAKYTGYEGWRLDPNDPDDANFLYLAAEVSKKHLPVILNKYGLEVMFGIAILGFTTDRVTGYRRFQAAQQVTSTVEQLLEQQKIDGSQEKDEISEPIEQATDETPPPDPTPEVPIEGMAAGSTEFLKRQTG